MTNAMKWNLLFITDSFCLSLTITNYAIASFVAPCISLIAIETSDKRSFCHSLEKGNLEKKKKNKVKT